VVDQDHRLCHSAGGSYTGRPGAPDFTGAADWHTSRPLEPAPHYDFSGQPHRPGYAGSSGFICVGCCPGLARVLDYVYSLLRSRFSLAGHVSLHFVDGAQGTPFTRTGGQPVFERRVEYRLCPVRRTAAFHITHAGHCSDRCNYGLTNGPLLAVVQAVVAPDMQGRVFSLINSVSTGMTPLGLAIAGPVADALGVNI